MTGHIIPVTGDKIRVHMHITLAKEDGSVFGGHLDEAILYTGGYLFLKVLEEF